MWNLVFQPMMRWYYRRTYEPEPLPTNLNDIPPVYRLYTVPWIATYTPVCQSTGLQMLAAHYGIDQPRRYFDFLMGFTYGASDKPGVGFFPVGIDPEVGLKDAAPYLGLRRRYLVTDDSRQFVQSLRHFLSREIPLRVPLDMRVLYDSDEPVPHNEVLIGYDDRGFEYYEPVCREPAGCRPSFKKPGDIGLYVEDERLVAAVEAEAVLFHYPWRYMVTLLEPGPWKTDLKPLWQRNGRALIGGANFGIRYGAAAIRHLANLVEKEGMRFDFVRLLIPFEIAAHVRCENAAFMGDMNGHQPCLLEAASCFEQSARLFGECLYLLRQGLGMPGQIQELSRRLRDAADADLIAGQIFLEMVEQL